MRGSILIIFCCAVLSNEHSFSQSKEVTKEVYNWGNGGAHSDNQSKVLKKTKRIRSLSIYNYTDSIFPNEFVLKFPNLKHLLIEGNPKDKHILHIDSAKSTKMPLLIELVINNFNVAKSSSAFCLPDNLEILIISSCNLEKVTNDIARLKSLRQLYLIGNALSNIHDTIRSLSRLELIYLSNNKFILIPKALISLPAIRAIYLDNYREKGSENLNLNDIDFKKEYDSLFMLAIKHSVKEIHIETVNCDENKFIKESFKRDMGYFSIPTNNPFKKAPIEKVSMRTKTGKFCLSFSDIF